MANRVLLLFYSMKFDRRKYMAYYADGQKIIVLLAVLLAPNIFLRTKYGLCAAANFYVW